MDDELRHLIADWQTEGVALDELATRARRQQRLGTLATRFGWLLVCAMTGWCAWTAWRNPHPVIIAPSIFIPLWIGAVAAWLTRLDQRARLDDAQSVSGWLAVMQRRWETEVAIARTRWPIASLVAFVLIWVPWKLVADREFYRAEPEAAVIGFGGMALILVGVLAALRRLRRHAERKAAALATMAEERKE